MLKKNVNGGGVIDWLSAVKCVDAIIGSMTFNSIVCMLLVYIADNPNAKTDANIT